MKRIGSLGKAVVVLSSPSKDEAQRDIVRRVVTKDFGARLLAVAIENQPELALALADGRALIESAPRKAAAKVMQKLYGEIAAIDAQVAASARRTA